MLIRKLWLKDFRSYEQLQTSFADGTCVVLGPNGVGKSNLIEAICYAGQLESFRMAPGDALVRRGCDSAIVRAEFLRDGREALVEAEISRTGRNRVLLNKQRLVRSADLIKWILITVFAPTDLDIVKGGPALRRGLVDQLLISMDPRNETLRSGFEKALRQRNALLKQVHGKLDDSASVTLDVWDSKLVEMGEALAAKRIELLSTMAPFVQRAYGEIAGVTVDIGVDYKSSWHDSGLVDALKAARVDDLRRGVTTVGPHRDDIELTINEMPARTHASQGEQRTLALGLRLAGHRLLSDTQGSPPVLLLDDVFSELDDQRTEALLAAVPQGQRIITTATDPPTSVHTDQLLLVTDGVVEERTA